jgi:hypothetical protein
VNDKREKRFATGEDDRIENDAGERVTRSSVLIGIAPVIGAPRTLAAALTITEGLGIVIVALEHEFKAGEEAR